MHIKADRVSTSSEQKSPLEQVYGPGSISAGDGVRHIKQGTSRGYDINAPMNLELSQPQSQKRNEPDVVNLG